MLTQRLESVVATTDEVSDARQFVDWKYPIDAPARASTDLLATVKEHADPKLMKKPLGRQLALELLWKAWCANGTLPQDERAWASLVVTLLSVSLSQYARAICCNSHNPSSSLSSRSAGILETRLMPRYIKSYPFRNDLAVLGELQ